MQEVWRHILLMSIRKERSGGVDTRHPTLDYPLPEAQQHYADPVMQEDMWHAWADQEGFPLLPDTRPISTVRDSLYDLIPLGAREEKLIGTSAFLRLQHVKQLGFVYRIWPVATHTRYEHSLGCYHLTICALRALLQRGDDNGLAGISVSSIRALGVAA